MHYTPFQKRLFLAASATGVVLVFFLTNFYIFNALAPDRPEMILTRVLFGASRAFVGLFIQIWIALQVIKYFESRPVFSRDQPWRWLVYASILTSIAVVVALFEQEVMLRYAEGLPSEKAFFKRMNFVLNAILSLIAFSVAEIWDIFDTNRSLQTRLAEAERDRVQQQLAALQQKLDPHFLFNSLNALSSLIYEDRDKADRFIQSFARVYRYVIEYGDQSLVPLRRELLFLKDYVYLQEIRFGENLKVALHNCSAMGEWQVPHMSLQLLIENAIKHNQVTRRHPLEVSITIQDDYVTVVNNRRPRTDQAAGTGTGLANLRDRYALLTDREPEVIITDTHYTVRLPLCIPVGQVESR